MRCQEELWRRQMGEGVVLCCLGQERGENQERGGG
jgi:hypothetical protein